MKIWCQLPLKVDVDASPGKLLADMLAEDYALVKRPDTEVVIKAQDKGIFSITEFGYPGLRYLNDAEGLKTILRAEEEGFDAVVISCYFDPALKAAKALLSIPVIGAGEATMHFASMMGLKFATITSDSRYVPEMTEQIAGYGMLAHAIERNPVRSLTLSEAEFMGCLMGEYTPAVSSFREVAKGCIEDGAEVLIVGCGVLSPMLTLRGVKEIDGVCIIDPEIVAIKMAEMMAELAGAGMPTVCKKGLYLASPSTGWQAVSKIFE